MNANAIQALSQLSYSPTVVKCAYKYHIRGKRDNRTQGGNNRMSSFCLVGEVDTVTHHVRIYFSGIILLLFFSHTP
jgi:hypothetical protein